MVDRNGGMLLVALAAVMWPAPARAQMDLPIGDGRWELKGRAIAIERFDGRDVISAENGFAYRRDVRLEDGTVEFDVMLTRRRSFVYVTCRMADDREYEDFYLRPHKSGLPDAAQYAPVWQGQSAWQLYHGPGGTAAVPFEAGIWTRVRLVLQGRRAALLLGDGTKPALYVPRLAREPKPGYIALRAFSPDDVGAPVARFANVRVRNDVAVDLRSLPDPTAAEQAGTIRAWSVSSHLTRSKEDATALPQLGPATGFQRIDAETGGLVPLHRHVKLPDGIRDGVAVARVSVRSDREVVRAFDLGFSDDATVFLNGKPLWSGVASYSFDTPRREGLIGFDQARLYLPLQAGENTLAVLVSDGFGGWGLMGRFVDATGLVVEAR